MGMLSHLDSQRKNWGSSNPKTNPNATAMVTGALKAATQRIKRLNTEY